MCIVIGKSCDIEWKTTKKFKPLLQNLMVNSCIVVANIIALWQVFTGPVYPYCLLIIFCQDVKKLVYMTVCRCEGLSSESFYGLVCIERTMYDLRK